MKNCRIPLSAVVLTKDEEKNIKSCLDTIEGWADEIFIVDSGSSDRTLEIASQYTRNIFEHPFLDYASQRNWAQDNLPLSHDWVFHIDADERVSPDLTEQIRNAFSEGQFERVNGFLVRRKIRFLGSYIKHGGIYPTYHCRVFRRSCGRCESRRYDQHFLVIGGTNRLESDLIEETASSLFSWTARHNRWAQMEAAELRSKTLGSAVGQVQANITGSAIERRRWLRTSIYARSPMFIRSLLYFLLRYVVRGGFLDGTPGLIYHVLHGFWFRFYVDACVYEARYSTTLDYGLGKFGSDRSDRRATDN